MEKLVAALVFVNKILLITRGGVDDEKTTRIAIQKIGCAVICLLIIITLAVCLLARDFTPRRIIRMNFEVALLISHLILLAVVELDTVTMSSDEVTCKVMAILLHFTYLTSFWLLLLESIHLYGMSKRRKESIISKIQNLVFGWGVPAVVVALCAGFLHQDYINEYTCWLPIDNVVFYLQLIPNSLLSIISLILVLRSHKLLSDMSDEVRDQLVVAQLMKTALLVIIPISLADWLVGVFAVRYLNVVSHAVFTVLTCLLGLAVLYFHCFRNPEVITWFYESDNKISPDLIDKLGGKNGGQIDMKRLQDDLTSESAFSDDSPQHVKFKAAREWRNNLHLSMETPLPE